MEQPTLEGALEQRTLEQELSESYLSYALSVIVSRALPDARDGLKPVQRRILYAMLQLGLNPDSEFKKCARIVGEVLGRYHPHGDAPVYEALVRLAQPFCMRYPLIWGQGNFGSIDGDPPAAMRYTGAKLSPYAMELLDEVSPELVEFSPNFDHSAQEPQVLPAKFPNLLANGCLGIAVGFSTNIPPHNLGEVIDGILAVMQNPEISAQELAQIISGPDFPTGGIALGNFQEICARGKGRFWVRARITPIKFRRAQYLLVDQIPYLVSKSEIVSQIWELIKSKKLPEIAEIVDGSDSSGIKLYLKLSSGVDPNQAIQKLYSSTKLQTEFRQLNLVILNNLPMVANLKQLIQIYLDHRRAVLRAKLSAELSRILKKLKELEAILKFRDLWESGIRILMESKDPARAKQELSKTLKLSSTQASYLLKLRLEQLLGSNLDQIRAQSEQLIQRSNQLRFILKHPAQLDELLKQELIQLKSKYGDPRRTQLIQLES